MPWAGRTLAPTGFEGDDGSADPGLAAALRRLAAGDADLADVARALGDVRVLVPVVAVLTESEQVARPGQATGADRAAERPASGSLTGDKAADMALVTLTAPDGRRALPVFSSVPALAAWDESARPVPVGGRRAALSAVAEGCSLLVVDPSGPVSATLPRPALWAVAQGVPWTPALHDPEVAAAVGAAAGSVDGVRTTRCEPGRRAELAVVLGIRKGLDRPALQRVLHEVTRRLAESAVVADRVDSLELRPVATEE
ncbi:MAG: SseB family protein [Actinomycetes bacterium]